MRRREAIPQHAGFNVQDACGKLREARELLKAAGADRAARVRLALSSALGAQRHAGCRLSRVR